VGGLGLKGTQRAIENGLGCRLAGATLQKSLSQEGGLLHSLQPQQRIGRRKKTPLIIRPWLERGQKLLGSAIQGTRGVVQCRDAGQGGATRTDGRRNTIRGALTSRHPAEGGRSTPAPRFDLLDGFMQVAGKTAGIHLEDLQNPS
jgi:hypothetical protein